MSSSTPYQLAAKDDLRGLMVIGQLFALLCLLVCVAAFGILYVNTKWTYEYTRFGSGPPSPGKFFNRRFSFGWIVLAVPAFNALTPFILLMVMSNPLRRTWARLYYWWTLILIIVTSLLAVIMLFQWCGFFFIAGARNSAYVPGNLANDDRYCCVHHPTNVLECPNSPVDCPLDPSIGPMPVVTQADLNTNSIFWLHWVLMGWFILSGLFHFGMVGSFKEYVARAEFVAD